MMMCPANKGNDALAMLAEAEGIVRDEIFNGKVTYSNVKIADGKFCFTQTMLHSEQEGTYKTVRKCCVPIKNLTEAERTVIAEKGIGRNPIVSFKAEKDTAPFEDEVTIEIRDSKGELIEPIRTNNSASNFCELNFSSPGQAEAWNTEFTKLLDEYKNTESTDTLSELRNAMAKNFFKAQAHIALAKYHFDKNNRLLAFYLCEDIRRALVTEEDFNKAFFQAFPIKNSEADFPEDIDTEKKMLQFVEQNPDTPQAFLYEASLLLENNPPEARKILEKGIAKWPQIGEFYFNLGVLAQKEENFKAAETYFVKSAELSKDSVHTQSWVGRFFFKVKEDNEKALDYYLTAYFLNPHAYETEYVEYRISKINYEFSVEMAEKHKLKPDDLFNYNNPSVIVQIIDMYSENFTKADILKLMQNDGRAIRWKAAMLLKEPKFALTESEIQELMHGNDLRIRGLAAYLWVYKTGKRGFDALDSYLDSKMELLQYDAVSALIMEGGEEGKKYLDAKPKKLLAPQIIEMLNSIPETNDNTDENLQDSREVKEEYTKEEQFNPTEKQKLWALAACAVLTKYNGQDTNTLGGCDPTPQNIEAWTESLKEKWGIENRESLLQFLNWLKTEGQRTDYANLGEMLSRMNPSEIEEFKKKCGDNSEKLNKIQVCSSSYKLLGPGKSLLGWDGIIYISLCGWGYIAGYLTEDEAWNKIMPMAKKIQKTFAQWYELTLSYISGRQYWSLSETQKNGQRIQETYTNIVGNPKNLWNELPWDLNLE